MFLPPEHPDNSSATRRKMEYRIRPLFVRGFYGLCKLGALLGRFDDGDVPAGAFGRDGQRRSLAQVGDEVLVIFLPLVGAAANFPDGNKPILRKVNLYHVPAASDRT